MFVTVGSEHLRRCRPPVADALGSGIPLTLGQSHPVDAEVEPPSTSASVHPASDCPRDASSFTLPVPPVAQTRPRRIGSHLASTGGLTFEQNRQRPRRVAWAAALLGPGVASPVLRSGSQSQNPQLPVAPHPRGQHWPTDGKPERAAVAVSITPSVDADTPPYRSGRRGSSRRCQSRRPLKQHFHHYRSDRYTAGASWSAESAY